MSNRADCARIQQPRTSIMTPQLRKALDAFKETCDRVHKDLHTMAGCSHTSAVPRVTDRSRAELLAREEPERRSPKIVIERIEFY